MQLILEMTEGSVPESPEGGMGYYFVQCRSKHDGKIRTFGAYYLHKYGLAFEDGPCPSCPDPSGGEACHGAQDGQCPVTGWFEEKWYTDVDGVYRPLSGEVVAFAKQPEPFIK